VRRVFHPSPRSITPAGRSVRLAYLVNKSGRKIGTFYFRNIDVNVIRSRLNKIWPLVKVRYHLGYWKSAATFYVIPYSIWQIRALEYVRFQIPRNIQKYAPFIQKGSNLDLYSYIDGPVSVLLWVPRQNPREQNLNGQNPSLSSPMWTKSRSPIWFTSKITYIGHLRIMLLY